MSMVEGLISSPLDSGPESTGQVDALTPEDIAWVDSCLIKEMPDISDGNWNHIKDALLEIIDLYPQGFESSLAVSDNVPGGTDDNIDVDMLLSKNVKDSTFPSRDSDDPMNVTGIASEDPQNNDDIIDSSLLLSSSGNPRLPTYNEKDNVPGSTNNDVDIDMLLSNNVKEPTLPSRDSDDPMNEAGIASEDTQNNGDLDTSLLLSFSKNPFLPTYKEEVEVEGKENIQTGSSHELSEIRSEPPINDIFKVWDLNLPPVEDELAALLNKALSENSAESAPSVDSNLSVSLDDLIYSISDLSLE